MQSAHQLVVRRESQIVRSPRVMQVEGLFDVPPAERSALSWEVNLPLDEREWSVGLIVGPSGAGKSTVARELFGDRLVAGFDWPSDRSILDGFPEGMSIKEVVAALTAVGFGSPPAWMRPFQVLSNGEQFRVTVARALAEAQGLVVIDEFTSVVDRQVAKVASHAVQKTVRRSKKRLVAVTCHYDVIDWLQPDWVYQPHVNEFTWRCLQRHPALELEVHPVDRAAWRLFKHHHYLSGDLHAGAVCFGGFIGDECVAFAAYVHFPHPHARNIKMGHRLVVLPDYQGLGIGGRLDDWIGQHLYERGFRYHNCVAHPAMIAYYSKSPRWKHIGTGQKPARTSGNKSLARQHSKARKIALSSFCYVPPAK